MNRSLRSSLLGLALVSFAGVAAAHPDHGSASFMSGLAHPLLGLDHLLAMVAVGLWSATALPATRRAVAPVLFIALMLAGAVAGQAIGASALVEPGIAASVVLLGALLFAGRGVDARAGLVTIAAAGLVHGYAHGVEGTGAAFAAFAAGFTVATAVLHVAGLSLGATLARGRAWVVRVAALAVSTVGLALLVTRL